MYLWYPFYLNYQYFRRFFTPWMKMANELMNSNLGCFCSGNQIGSEHPKWLSENLEGQLWFPLNPYIHFIMLAIFRIRFLWL